MADILLGMHRRIVEELASRLRAMQRGNTTAPRLLLLNAPSGEGKTRIIRELFEKLRAQSPAPQYWPTLVGDARSGTIDPIAARRELSPALKGFHAPANALPSFGWWVFDAQRLNAGVAHSLTAEARPQWDAHATALTRAWNEANEATGATGPGERDAPGTVPTEGIALGRALRVLSHPRLPGVVVIEDMHLMGAELAALVEEASVADPDRPLLVIGTVEAEAPQHPEFVRWATRARGHVETFDVVQLPAADLIKMLRVYAPQTDDATAMRVVARLGGPLSLKLWLTSAEMTRHIELHGGAIDLGEAALPADASQVVADRWRALPEPVRAVLSCAVIASPLAVTLLATNRRSATPIAADGLAADGLVHIVPAVMAEAFAEFLGGAMTPDGVRAALKEAVSPAGWCRLDEGVQYFRESLLAEVVRAAAPTELRRLRGPGAEGDRTEREQTEEDRPEGGIAATAADASAPVAAAAMRADRAELRAIVRHHIERWIDVAHTEYTLPDSEVASVLARWYAALSQAPAPLPGPRGSQAAAPPPSEALAAALWRLACDAAARRDFMEAISRGRLARATLRRVLGDDHPAKYLREQLAAAPDNAGPTDTAPNDTASQGVPTAAPQPQVAPEWAMQLVISEWLGELGRPGESIDVLRNLLAEMERHAGTRHLATLTVRRDLARLLSEAGVAEEAIGQFRTVIADLSAVVGPLSPETLEARGGLAEALGVSGQYEQAVAELRALIPLYLEVYGEAHPDTFLVRGALAAFLSQSGQPRAAAEQARMLLEDQDKVLNADDPQVLTTRSNLAVMLLDSGEAEAAVEQFAKLAKKRGEVLGSTDPDTLDTRMNLAMALLEADNPQAAVLEFRATLGVMRQTLAPDHPSLLRGRGQLAEALGRAGDPRSAVMELRALERDVVRALGPRAGELALIEAAARYWERGGVEE